MPGRTKSSAKKAANDERYGVRSVGVGGKEWTKCLSCLEMVSTRSCARHMTSKKCLAAKAASEALEAGAAAAALQAAQPVYL